ncbi:MAG: hypothetical protein ACJAYP_000493 [Flavobacterium sp.]
MYFLHLCSHKLFKIQIMRLFLLLCFLTFSSVFSQIPTTNLNGQYKFTGGALNDSFGTNHLAQTGTALTSIADRFNTASNAVNLSGDYLQRSALPNATATSFSFWVKTSTNDAVIKTILDQTERTSDANLTANRGWYAYLRNGKVGLFSNFLYNYQDASTGSTITGNTGYYDLTSATTISDNNWHHIVITIKSRTYFWQGSNWVLENEYNIYIDNVLENTYIHYKHASTGWANNPNTFPNVSVTIGNNHLGNLNSVNKYEDGIDDIRIYSGYLLTPSDVNSLFLENPLTRLYVDANATGNNNGSSWANAYTSLHTALSAGANKDIWLKSGTYKPHPTNRGTYFTVLAGSKLYGGFDGTESELSDRVFGMNETILSGDLFSNDDNNTTYVNTTRDDNSYTVLYLLGDDVEINGLTITAGHANGGAGSATEARYGAGIYKNGSTRNVTINNCKITKNVSKEAGGAMSAGFTASGGIGSLIINNCQLSENLSAIGGVIYSANTGNSTVTYTISNSLFNKNKVMDTNAAATGYAGSSMWLRSYGSGSTLVSNFANCTFVDNVDEGTASGMNNTNRTTLTLTKNTGANHTTNISNCIFWNNKAASTTARPIGGYIESMISSATIKNSIDETNFTGITLSGTSANNSASNPLFTNAISGDYTLSTGSPAINSGDNASVIGTTDLLGNQRIYNITVDLGAYEFGSTVLGNENFSSFQDFTIYPNPAVSILNINSRDEISSVEIYSIEGKRILISQLAQVDVSHLTSGIYLVKIITLDSKVGTRKFVKQ